MVVQYPNGYHFMSLNGWLIKKYPVNQISETFEKLFQNTLKNYMDELHNSYQLSPEQYALLIICPQSRKIKQLKPHIFWYTFYFFFFGLRNNSIFGKSIKILSKRVAAKYEGYKNFNIHQNCMIIPYDLIAIQRKNVW